MVPTDQTRGNGHKLKSMKIHLNTRKIFFNMTVVKHRNGFPKEVVDSVGGDTQNLTGHSSRQPALDDMA